jgi:hypothetical protein
MVGTAPASCYHQLSRGATRGRGGMLVEKQYMGDGRNDLGVRVASVLVLIPVRRSGLSFIPSLSSPRPTFGSCLASRLLPLGRCHSVFRDLFAREIQKGSHDLFLVRPPARLLQPYPLLQVPRPRQASPASRLNSPII